MIHTHKAPAMAGALFFCNGEIKKRQPRNPSTAYGGPPPNRCPSPLSLRDISPHCGESPFAREAWILQPILQGPYASSINRPMLSFPSDPWVPADNCRIMHTVSQELYHIFACLHSGLQKNMAFFQDRKWRQTAERASTLQKNKSQTDLIHRTQKTARALRSGRFPLLRQAKDHLPI